MAHDAAPVAMDLSYSVGFCARADVAQAIETGPPRAWVPAIDSDGVVGVGAWVTWLTGQLNLGRRDYG